MTGSDPELSLPVQLTLDDRSGPAQRISRDRAAEMVAAALVEFDAVAPRSAAKRGVRGWSAGTWAAAAGALLVFAGGAAAARYYWHVGEPPAPVVAPAKPPAPAPAKPVQVEPTPALAEPADPQNENASEPVPPSKPRARTAISERALEDLLQRANHQRAAGNFREAAATYAQVYERSPKTQAAYVARVAGAAIELEHLSNPLRARKLFEQALRDEPRAALDLEARQGLTVALRDLEDRPAEIKALHALVQTHPDSPAARRAQVRLRELGDGADSE
jgi:tetratricopeptide (TPR) repeat protein